jgi:hypothetical protein
MGSMWVTAIDAAMDNVGVSTDTLDDVTGYELGVSFAF